MAMDLGKQVGPLPLGAWIVVVGAGVGIGVWQYRKSASQPTGVIDNTSTDQGVGVGGAGFDTTSPPPTDTGSVATITDNDAWGKAATDYLIAQGYDPTRADQAIRRYLASAPLDIQDVSLINVALRKLGSPPSPLPASTIPLPTIPKPPAPAKPVTPKPKPKPTPKPAPKPKTRTYTVRSGDTLSGIARRYYGSAAAWPRIFNANRSKISNPNVIHPGEVLVIP